MIAGQRSVKVWNAIAGRPVKLLSGVSKTEITAMELNDTHRKVIVGSHRGKIYMYDTLSGSFLKKFKKHKQEVTALYYVS